MQFSLLLLSVIAALAQAEMNLMPSNSGGRRLSQRPSNSGGTPAHLMVPKLKLCTGSENFPMFTIYCLPQAKPEHCPLSSWKQLTESTLPESQHWIVSKLLPLCSSAIPNFRSCTVEEKDHNTYLCLPRAKPGDCPSLSWKQLKESTPLRGCKTERCATEPSLISKKRREKKCRKVRKAIL